MAHHVDKTGFPGIPLQGGMMLVLEARSPTTDTAVTGVTSSLWSIYGTDKSEGLIEDVVPVYSLEETSGTA